MDEWSAGQWIVGVISFQKIFCSYGLKQHIVEISADVTRAGRTRQQVKIELWEAESRNFIVYHLRPMMIMTIFHWCLAWCVQYVWFVWWNTSQPLKALAGQKSQIGNTKHHKTLLWETTMKRKKEKHSQFLSGKPQQVRKVRLGEKQTLHKGGIQKTKTGKIASKK